jgi:mannose-6-phosphate isomerase-like protein (cupin superfamily)
MKALVYRPNPDNEFPTDERCHILELWNNEIDKSVSIARARVKPGITTQRHRLKGVEERYVIIKGIGVVNVEGLEPADVVSGDVVIIPDGAAQQITNSGDDDLVFYCICTPRFSPECYEALE